MCRAQGGRRSIGACTKHSGRTKPFSARRSSVRPWKRCRLPSSATSARGCIAYSTRAPRAAIVLGWAGFMDALHRRLASELQALQPKYAARFPKLSERHRLNDLATVRELDDWQALDLGLEMGYYPKSLLTQLNAMRDQRNHCAHIEEYPVTIEMALFFYASLANYTGQLASTP